MEELKRLRKARGLSQAKLAALADLDPSTVSQIETGARRANTRTLERLAEALGTKVADLFPKGQAALPLEDRKYMDRPEVHSWLREQGHMSRDEFLDWARALGSSTDEEEEVLQAVEDGIQKVLLKRNGILNALRTSEARKVLFPIPTGLSKAEKKGWLLKPPGRWELVNEIRREYSARARALETYSQQLFAEGKSSGYISHRHDRERHERLLEHRRKVLEERRRILEESYAEAVA